MQDAARREVLEEVGVETGALEVAGVLRYDLPDVRGVDFLFLCHDWQGKPRPLDKTSEVEWFTLDTLPTDTLPWLRPVLEQHLRYGKRVSEQLGSHAQTTGF